MRITANSIRNRNLALVAGAAAMIALAQAARAEVINAVFNCDGGLTLDVSFDNDKNTATVRTDGVDPVTLPIAMSGSGYAYANDEYGLRGKGEEATWEVKGKAPVDCKQGG